MHKIGHLSLMSQPLLTITCSSSTAVKKPVKKSIRRTTMLTSEIFDGVSDNPLTDIIVVFLLFTNSNVMGRRFLYSCTQILL